MCSKTPGSNPGQCIGYVFVHRIFPGKHRYGNLTRLRPLPSTSFLLESSSRYTLQRQAVTALSQYAQTKQERIAVCLHCTSLMCVIYTLGVYDHTCNGNRPVMLCVRYALGLKKRVRPCSVRNTSWGWRNIWVSTVCCVRYKLRLKK
jgi:hypothetical protein